MTMNPKIKCTCPFGIPSIAVAKNCPVHREPTAFAKEKEESGDCSKHKKEVAGISDMKALAEAIGDLHYETLHELIGRLAIKLYTDGLKDRMNKREALGYALNDASSHMADAAADIKKAWQISKPFMSNKDQDVQESDTTEAAPSDGKQLNCQ